jgi:hypothetical protein
MGFVNILFRPFPIFAVQERYGPFRKSRPLRGRNVVCSACRQTKKGGKREMAKERFVEVYNQGIVNVARIIVDTETGVNYLLGSHNKANGTGLTVLVDRDGKPIVTPVE